ncbi:hypothetical protein F5Y08DRAFT_124516 [Xylaria arbuscula]|nr:hypothetical protein F5Y08DRAFT_124516 [Xylaria arbuscula]
MLHVKLTALPIAGVVVIFSAAYRLLHLIEACSLRCDRVDHGPLLARYISRWVSSPNATEATKRTLDGGSCRDYTAPRRVTSRLFQKLVCALLGIIGCARR